MADESSQGRIALGRRLIHDANQVANVPSDHFVLLLGAYEAGRDASSLGVCIEAADVLADTYEVDGLKLKADVVSNLVTRKNGSASNAENCRNALSLLDELIAAEDYATASKLAAALRPMASGDLSLLTQLQNRAKAAEALRSGSESLSKDLATLKKSPNDAAANLSAGRFLCLLKGDWARGLPMLARGSDTKLKELASAEIARPSDSKAIEQLGDRWWELSATQYDLARAIVARHAASLFSDALDGASGIRKLLIEKKLDQASAASAAVSRRVNLLALISPQRDALSGNWKLEHGELIGNNMGALARVRIPYQPPEEYDYRIEFTRAEGNCIIQMLSHQHHNFKWVLDLSSHICGFDVIGGRNCDVNETHLEKPNSVRNGERCTCLVQVRHGWVAAYVNGQLFERCHVDFEQFSIDQMWELGNDCLGIGAADNNVTFHAIELTEITGAGRRSPTVK